MWKTALITIACVIVALAIYEVGKNLLGLDSYEENFEQLVNGR